MTARIILTIEDDPDQQQVIRKILEENLFTVLTAENGNEGFRLAKEKMPDLILLDLVLPEKDGREVLRTLKQDSATATIPIVILSSLLDETDIVVGLELGADDYITKPYSPKIMLARINAVLRRKHAAESDSGVIQIHGMRIDPERHDFFINDKKTELTLSEYRILYLLAQRPGKVFTRQQIVDAIHDGKSAVIDRTIDVMITGLRRKLGEHGKFIETVRGIGYRMMD